MDGFYCERRLGKCAFGSCQQKFGDELYIFYLRGDGALQAGAVGLSGQNEWCDSSICITDTHSIRTIIYDYVAITSMWSSISCTWHHSSIASKRTEVCRRITNGNRKLFRCRTLSPKCIFYRSIVRQVVASITTEPVGFSNLYCVQYLVLSMNVYVTCSKPIETDFRRYVRARTD